MKIAKLLGIQKISREYGRPKEISEYMFNSLTPFVVRAQSDNKACVMKYGNSYSHATHEFVPEKPKGKDKYFVVGRNTALFPITERISTHFPGADDVFISDGKNFMSVNTDSGLINKFHKVNPFITNSRLMKKFQKVIDKFPAN